MHHVARTTAHEQTGTVLGNGSLTPNRIVGESTSLDRECPMARPRPNRRAE